MMKQPVIRSNRPAKQDLTKLAPVAHTLILDYPPSANNYWRPVLIRKMARIGVTNEARKYKRLVKEALAVQWPYSPYTVAEKLHITIEAYPDSFRADVTNVPKVLLDALEGAVMVNDSVVVESTVKLMGRCAEPFVAVIITREPAHQTGVREKLRVDRKEMTDHYEMFCPSQKITL